MPHEWPRRFVPEFDQVWARLRGDWTWLVLLPAERGFSTARIAQSLSDAGQRLSAEKIGVVEAAGVDLDSASQLIGQFGSTKGARGTWLRGDDGGATSLPPGRTLVALESPLDNPLALPVALAADGIVLCVRKGQSKLAEVRQTIAAVGEDRIVCCILTA